MRQELQQELEQELVTWGRRVNGRRTSGLRAVLRGRPQCGGVQYGVRVRVRLAGAEMGE